jgi:hypothetical protein
LIKDTRRYRSIVQEAPAAVFPSVTASKEGAAHFLAGIGNRGSECRVRAPTGRASSVLTVYRRALSSLLGVIPEIDIWLVASLMLKRYGARARPESARHADELWAAGDATGEVIWLRIGDVIGQLANTTPADPVH